MKRLSVLVPTYDKDAIAIFSLTKSLNINGRAIISNQNNQDNVIDEGNITIINNNTKGVSVNRNILLNAVNNEYCLFIDDDCRLIDDYELIVLKEFDKYKDAEVIVFSRDSQDSMFPSVVLKDKKVKRFYQISKMGAPGIAIKTNVIKKYNLKFNEKLGAPNYFYNGEDSLFLYELIKKKVMVYSSSIQIFLLLPSMDKSSYFKSYDTHFFESVGGVQYLLHKHSYYFYLMKQAFYYRKKTNCSFIGIMRSLENGVRKVRETGITTNYRK